MKSKGGAGEHYRNKFQIRESKSIKCINKPIEGIDKSSSNGNMFKNNKGISVAILGSLLGSWRLLIEKGS